MPRLAATERDVRRHRLIDAALRCVASKGFRELTVDEVCAAAGVSKGTFYGYFETKHDLLIALLDEDAAAIEHLMQQLDRAELPGPERLRQFARAFLERSEGPGITQLSADLWGHMLTEPAVQTRLSEAVARRRVVLREWVQHSVQAGEMVDIPANAFASILLALGDGLMIHASADPAGFKWPNIRKALDALLDGISTA